MAYTSWSVVFGEQPSAAKWNQLGTNDASFNDGTGIGDDVITDRKLIYGKLRTRQGGSSTSFATAGTTSYDYSATNTFIQCGSKTVGSGTFVVTFPTAFNQVPTVVFTVRGGSGLYTGGNYYLVSETATDFTFQCSSANAVTISWIAIGV